MKHIERLKRSYELIADPEKMTEFYLKVMVLNCMVHMLDHEVLSITSDVDLLLDKKIKQLINEAGRKCDHLVDRLYKTANSNMDPDAYCAIVERAQKCKALFRDFLLFCQHEWQYREIKNTFERVLSEEEKAKVLKQLFETNVERCEEFKNKIRANQ